jgi:hypothetical protein
LGDRPLQERAKANHKDIMGLRLRHKTWPRIWAAKPQNPRAATKVAAQSEISVKDAFTLKACGG